MAIEFEKLEFSRSAHAITERQPTRTKPVVVKEASLKRMESLPPWRVVEEASAANASENVLRKTLLPRKLETITIFQRAQTRSPLLATRATTPLAKSYLVRNSFATAEQLGILWQKGNLEKPTLIALARHANCPREVQDKLHAMNDAFIDQALAKNPTIAPHIARDFQQRKEFSKELVANPGTSGDVLGRIVEDALVVANRGGRAGWNAKKLVLTALKNPALPLFVKLHAQETIH